jgi:hypothetical protein
MSSTPYPHSVLIVHAASYVMGYCTIVQGKPHPPSRSSIPLLAPRSSSSLHALTLSPELQHARLFLPRHPYPRRHRARRPCNQGMYECAEHPGYPTVRLFDCSTVRLFTSSPLHLFDSELGTLTLIHSFFDSSVL